MITAPGWNLCIYKCINY